MLQLHEYRAILRPVLLDAVPTGPANIERGLAAIDKALKGRTTVHRAMYREGLGWVDFVWGAEGKWPPDARGRRKGEKGISHVLEARPRKDGMTAGQALATLHRMVRTIAEGAETGRFSVKSVERIIVGRDGTEVHLIKRPGSNAWALTVFIEQE